jgi:hypothetical protein
MTTSSGRSPTTDARADRPRRDRGRASAPSDRPACPASVGTSTGVGRGAEARAESDLGAARHTERAATPAGFASRGANGPTARPAAADGRIQSRRLQPTGRSAPQAKGELRDGRRSVGSSRVQMSELVSSSEARRAEGVGSDRALRASVRRSHRRAQCRWLWHRRLRRIRVEKPSGAGLPLLPRAAILKAHVEPAHTIWWATL